RRAGRRPRSAGGAGRRAGCPSTTRSRSSPRTASGRAPAPTPVAGGTLSGLPGGPFAPEPGEGEAEADRHEEADQAQDVRRIPRVDLDEEAGTVPYLGEIVAPEVIQHDVARMETHPPSHVLGECPAPDDLVPRHELRCDD